MKIVEEDGVKWKVWTEGDRTIWQLVTPRAERNRLRKMGVVPKWLRVHLEKMEHEGTLNVTGSHLLQLERKKGGKFRKVPLWWLGPKVTGEAWEVFKGDRSDWDAALELSEMALAELDLDVDLTVWDVRNARREWKSRA